MTTATDRTDTLAERLFEPTVGALDDAYRTGGGVPYRTYGHAFRHGPGHINRPAFTHELASDWLPAMPDVLARLESAQHGWSVTHCLPSQLAEHPSAALVCVLPVDNDFFRLYRLDV